MTDNADGEQLGPALHIRMDPDVRRRLDAFCEDTYRNRTSAVNMLLSEALTAHDEIRQQDKPTHHPGYIS